MAIKKQEFYEGAALHLLIRAGGVTSIRYESPFFVINEWLSIYIKYSTRSRSPWGFTFTTTEQGALEARGMGNETVIGLVCGSDGVVAFSFDAYRSVAGAKRSKTHIACYRRHGEHYEVNGPEGTIAGKVAPGNWLKLLNS